MLHRFSDINGNEWTVKVTVGSLRRAIEVAGIDLLNLFGKEGAEEGEQPPIVRFFQDFDSLGRALFAVVKPEADQRGIDLDQFLEGLAGDAIEQARKSLLDACVDFFPSPAQRRAYRTIVEEVGRAFRDAMEDAERQISPESIRAALSSAADSQDSGGTSSSSPATSA